MFTRREKLAQAAKSYVNDFHYELVDEPACLAVEGPITISIPDCPICNRPHANLVCYPVHSPQKGWTHEAPCPNSPDDILLFSFEHDDSDA